MNDEDVPLWMYFPLPNTERGLQSRVPARNQAMDGSAAKGAVGMQFGALFKSLPRTPIVPNTITI